MPLESLLSLEPYAPHTVETDELFKKALGSRLQAHMEGNALYADYLRRKGFDPGQPFELENIPFLPARLFKILGARLATVPEEDISQRLTSSATSGIPSTVPISRSGAQMQRRCMAQTLAQFIGRKRRPFLILDTDPALAPRSGSYGARGAAVRGYMTFASKSSFFMLESPEGLIFDQEAFVRALEQASPDVPLIIFGFTYILYSHVARALHEAGKSFHLPQGSQILHIGGWKKLEKEKVSREHFLKLISGLFGVEKSAVVDIYGFTEQMGLNYPDCACGCKHAPHMSRVLVRDPLTLRPLPNGQQGLLEFISPLPASYAGSAVLTDDLGVLVDGACPYGRGGQRFQIIGRLPRAEPRGCGDIMGEKMRRTYQVAAPATSGILRVHSWPAGASDIDALVRHVRSGGEWLKEQKLEDLVGLVSRVASGWEQNPFLSHWRHQGLSFLARWCSAPNLRALARQGTRGMIAALDKFTPEPGREKRLLRAMPVGLVVHWLSGNVPLLAFLLLVQSILTKNCNILKTASNNLDTLKSLLDTFSGAIYQNPEGQITRGDDLLSSIGLVHYGHGDTESARALSHAANARIAWGGREAIDAICSLESHAETVDLVFGPKSSFMAIAKEAIADDKALHKILRRAATDVSSFDQAACSSPHTIFVEKGGIASPEEFARLLGSYLEKNLVLIPKNPEDEPTIAAIQTARAVGEFMGQCWHSDGPGWTVLYDDRQELAAPVYSRVITVRPLENLMDAASFAREGIQTIGLAAEGEKRLAFAEACAARGALRFPEIGAMTLFDSPWDGMFAMDRLIRWISLGGSASVITRA